MSEKGSILKKTKDSTPPGVLNSDQIGRFKTIQEDIAELPLKSIQPFHRIPNYSEPTESTLPIAVQSPAGCYCIDGWHYIKQAKTAGQSAIRCYVFHIQEHSEIELALRKMAIRTKPQGGKCLCAELVRNAKIVEKYLMDEMENPIVFSHGGARQGENFTNNKEDDLRQVLSDRLGKDRSTINDYLNFGRHLTDKAMDKLVAQKAGKAFFEKVRVNKRILVKNLESDGLTPEDIAVEVSKKILEWHTEHQQTGKIKTDYDEPEQTGDIKDQSTETIVDSNLAGSREIETFHHRSPATDIEIPGLPTEEGIKIKIQAVINQLSELTNLSPVDFDRAFEIVGGQIEQLAMVQQLLVDIRDRTAIEKDKEAT